MSAESETSAGAVLTVDGLDVGVGADAGTTAVRDVSFRLAPGEALALVGESGSGKSLTCRSVLGVLPAGCRVTSGRIGLTADGADRASGPAAGSSERVELTALSRRDWDSVRGRRLAAVFQDPASYLNPSLTVGRQLAEQVRVGLGLSRRDARARAVELLADVGLHGPAELYHQYPHELSGGMLQRVLIAIAVSCTPEILIADEATTALDVVIQAEILELLRTLRREQGLALLLVTHDLAVVADSCDRVVVMYAGEIVEEGPTGEVLEAPAHPYTAALLKVASIGEWGRRSLDTIPGRPPETGAELPGCRFAERCAFATARCTEQPVPLRTRPDGRRTRCVHDSVPAAEGPQSRQDEVPAAVRQDASAVAEEAPVSAVTEEALA
ncbi:Oligopeptide transport ATP-binding protein OppD [Streptomyces sp. YIM 130001]|uniref:ABC transporter ATP-binding protein n=1 Tax=Streptomyces sp. YIM 130001 TaxID=2259644 RepID=UPI000ED224D0|nr:ABC transporter ATP-binding protein [Streptomyces sp. YIM 130001]RII14677.1 Oligopeptide transport ATP-binding protein OppD [Streptomyces sp. YIM 130001]